MGERQSVNILLVDDQPAKLLSLCAILADLGENLIQSGSASDALRILLETDVAVVLMDVCMPNMDGFELAELIRGHPRFERTAIIFISAVHLTDADRLKGYKLGAVDYIPVPIIADVLRAKVAVFSELYRKTLELSRLNEELKLRVAELDQSHERLRMADRMATIGTLSAGLGHDMGNLLVPIRVRLEALEQAGLPHPLVADVQAIKTSTQYLQRLANGLRLLAARPELAGAGEGTEVLGWWDDALPLLKSVLPMGIRLEAERPREESWLSISRAALTQAVFNLVQNAGDALRERQNGTVTFTCRRDGPDALLIVDDDGPGMSAEVRQRCMEPFFTTKTRSISTGLGLALVYGLVQDCGGSVTLDSEPGRGTCFTLRFPLRAAPLSLKPGTSRGIAVVGLKDSRLRAFVTAELKSMAYSTASNANGRADLMVVDSLPGQIPPGARVLVVDDSAAPLPHGCERSGASPSAIRRVLRRIAGSSHVVPQTQLMSAGS